MRDHPFDLKTQIADRIQATPDAVWTPVDFLDLGSRDAVDKTLQRLTLASQIRRLDRGLYDRPRRNHLWSSWRRRRRWATRRRPGWW
jgi:hypothetical protein